MMHWRLSEKGESGGWIIDIDVDKMTTRHQVTLTVHNLKIDALMDRSRLTGHEDLTAAMTVDKVQVTVSSKQVLVCCPKRQWRTHPLASNVSP